MATINDNYLKLPGSYLFAEIARRVAAFKEAHPEADIIRLGIGDVTQPLPAACIEAMHKAVDEENQPAKQLLHDLLEGALIAVQKTAVAVGSGVHVLSSFGIKAHAEAFHLLYVQGGRSSLSFFIAVKNRL